MIAPLIFMHFQIQSTEQWCPNPNHPSKQARQMLHSIVNLYTSAKIYLQTEAWNGPHSSSPCLWSERWITGSNHAKQTVWLFICQTHTWYESTFCLYEFSIFTFTYQFVTSTVEPHLTDTPEMRTSAIMRTLCLAPNVLANDQNPWSAETHIFHNADGVVVDE